MENGPLNFWIMIIIMHGEITTQTMRVYGMHFSLTTIVIHKTTEKIKRRKLTIVYKTNHSP